MTTLVCTNTIVGLVDKKADYNALNSPSLSHTPSPSRTRQLPNQVILIYKYPGKPPKENLAKTPRHILFFFDILPLFIFFSLSFPFYIRDDQSPKNSDGNMSKKKKNMSGGFGEIFLEVFRDICI